MKEHEPSSHHEKEGAPLLEEGLRDFLKMREIKPEDYGAIERAAAVPRQVLFEYHNLFIDEKLPQAVLRQLDTASRHAQQMRMRAEERLGDAGSDEWKQGLARRELLEARRRVEFLDCLRELFGKGYDGHALHHLIRALEHIHIRRKMEEE